MTLADLESGRIGTIKCLSAVGIQRQRLLDLGLVPGTKVAMLFANPAGSPIAYLIRGTVVALRRETAEAVEIESTGGGCGHGRL
ncbi:MAG: ferrous iron transport protein A [Firmicutes bacterium]|jgi:Fe2+ transport system protein FeoA|nr:FeoA family protein [Bacillota bacterium]NLO66608.1 ferrous iron transport protein A [Bacillota bacterium]